MEWNAIAAGGFEVSKTKKKIQNCLPLFDFFSLAKKKTCFFTRPKLCYKCALICVFYVPIWVQRKTRQV